MCSQHLIYVVLLCLMVLPGKAQIDSNRSVILTAQGQNSQSRQTTPSVGNPRDGSTNTYDKEAIEEKINPAFMKSLNEVLMKFLREVTTIVKESPMDAEKMEQEDVSKLLSKSLTTLGPIGSTEREQPQRRLPPKVPPNTVVPLETAFSLGGHTNEVGQQSLTYWKNDTRKSEPEDKTKETKVISNQTSTELPKKFINQSNASITKKIPVRIMTNYGVEKLNRNILKTSGNQPKKERILMNHLTPSRHLQPSNIPPKNRVQSYQQNRLWKFHGSTGLRTSGKINLIQRQQPKKQPQMSKPMSNSRKDLIIQKHRTNDLIETISRPAQRESSSARRRIFRTGTITPWNKFATTNTTTTTITTTTTTTARASLRAGVSPQFSSRRPNTAVMYRKYKGISSRIFKGQSSGTNSRATLPISKTLHWHPIRQNRTVKQEGSPPNPSAIQAKKFRPSSTIQLRNSVNQTKQDIAGRHLLLNDLIFDLFNRLGIQSFFMKTDEGTLKGSADPKHTEFIPLEIFKHSEQGNQEHRSTNQQFPKRNLQQFGNDMRVMLRGNRRNPSTVPNRRITPSLRGQRWPTATNKRRQTTTTNRNRNTVFFRNRSGRLTPWHRTLGITRKELRNLSMRKNRQ